MPRPHRSYPSRGPRRQTDWVGTTQQGYVAVATTVKVAIASFTPDASANNMQMPTAIRNRGSISVRPNSTGADLDIVGAFGMCVVTQDALAVGITAIPGPFTDSQFDGWMVWQPFSLRVDFSDATGTRLFDRDYEIDSKAMRKVPSGYALVQVAESFSGAFSISATIRTLMKLS